jgi:elongation factor 2
LDLKVSDPIASYRETALKKGAIVTVKSSIGLNEFWVQVEPLDQKTLESFEENAPFTKDRLREQVSSLVEGNILAAEEHFNVLVDLSEISKRLHSVLDAVISGFEWACRTGPLCGQPLRGLKVNITDAIVDTNPENTESTQISRAMSRSILGSFLTAEPILLEPISRIEVSVSLQWLGPCVNVIVHRHGKIESTEKKGGSATVRGYIPVAYTFGLATDLRSATSGHAFWQLVFHHWERMPDRRSVETIQKLREKKGLPFGVPKPETFVDKICS